MKLLLSLRRKRHIFLMRRKLKRQILQLGKSQDVKLNIGSSVIHYDGWVSLDLPFFNLTREDLWLYFFGETVIDNILMEHVLEHLSYKEVKLSLSLAWKYMHKDGIIRIAVPDRNHPNPRYIEYSKPGGSGLGADDHKSFWSYSDFEELATELNYDINFIEYYDEKGELHCHELRDELGIIRRSFRKIKDHEIEGYSSLIFDLKKQPQDSSIT